MAGGSSAANAYAIRDGAQWQGGDSPGQMASLHDCNGHRRAGELVTQLPGNVSGNRRAMCRRITGEIARELPGDMSENHRRNHRRNRRAGE
jgi:hypothetical protein